jgi:hypothetical protein
MILLQLGLGTAFNINPSPPKELLSLPIQYYSYAYPIHIIIFRDLSVCVTSLYYRYYYHVYGVPSMHCQLENIRWRRHAKKEERGNVSKLHAFDPR